MPLSAFTTCVLVVCCMAASAPEKIKVVCGKDLRVTEQMGVRGDWGGESAWSATAHDDTLILLRKGSCGDECRYEEKIVLRNVKKKCPSLVSATITRTDLGSVDPSPRVQRATRGTLGIQDWPPSGGVVSGRLEAEFTLTFFARIPAPAVAPKK